MKKYKQSFYLSFNLISDSIRIRIFLVSSWLKMTFVIRTECRGRSNNCRRQALRTGKRDSGCENLLSCFSFLFYALYRCVSAGHYPFNNKGQLENGIGFWPWRRIRFRSCCCRFLALDFYVLAVAECCFSLYCLINARYGFEAIKVVLWAKSIGFGPIAFRHMHIKIKRCPLQLMKPEPKDNQRQRRDRHPVRHADRHRVRPKPKEWQLRVWDGCSL